jgi:hypothetical protein
MSCYCNGNLSNSGRCSTPSFPLSQQLNCSLNCDNCKWANLTEWSPCKGGSQYQTRDCSCTEQESSNDEDHESTNQKNIRSYKFSSLCNGYNRIFRSCGSGTTLRVLSVQSWKTATWPEANKTKSRNFSAICSKATWFEVINKTDYNDWDTLAAEYIAAHLNILSGAASEDDISTNLTSAKALLYKCPWTDEQKSESDELLQNLREFNNKDMDSDNFELGSSDENTANSKNANNAATNSLILWIVIPSVIVVVAAILVGLFFYIKKRRVDNDTVEL